MLNISGIIGKFLKNSSQRDIDKLKAIVQKINAWEPKVKEVPDENFPLKSEEFKSKIKNGAKLETLIPEVFAYVREASRRTLSERHFDVQLMGGIILHQGKIAEMKTGEGKTLVATLPAYLNSLNGKGVHIVTVNDYLAKRDSDWMGKIYKFLGLFLPSCSRVSLHLFKVVYPPFVCYYSSFVLCLFVVVFVFVCFLFVCLFVFFFYIP